MNILFIASWWPTYESSRNGIFIKEHALAINNVHNVFVIYPGYFGKNTLLKRQKSIAIRFVNSNEGLKEYELSGNIFVRKFGFLERKIIAQLKLFIAKHQIDIIHLNVLPTFISKVILKNSHILKRKIVLTEHSSYYHREIFIKDSVPYIKKKTELISLLSKTELRCIMPVSKDLSNILVQDYQYNGKIYIVPNIANPVFDYYNKNITQDTINISLIALWNAPKNPIIFLKVLSKLFIEKPDFFYKLRINWFGDGQQMQEVKMYIKEKLADLQITFHGIAEKKTLSAFFNTSAFFVHPTSAENLPTVIIESLSCGCPVLSSSINGITELINESNGLLYINDNIDSFYNNLLKMCRSYMLYDRKLISESSKQKYSAHTISKQIDSVYNSINNL